MKKIIPALLSAALFVALSGANALAGETSYRFDPVAQTSRALVFKNLWAGYKTFENSCKTCHYRGNNKGATFLHTESKSMRAWNRVFYERYPQCAKNGYWDKLSQEEIISLNDYLYSKAANTYNPNNAKSCG